MDAEECSCEWACAGAADPSDGPTSPPKAAASRHRCGPREHDDPRPWRARVRRAWPVAKYVIGLVLAALAFEQLVGHKSELTEATLALRRLRWEWVLLGVAAEAGSFLAFAQVQRRSLRAGRADVAIGPMVAITLAAQSITNSLPAGSVIAPVYAFRQYRRRGADEAVAGWSVVATFVVASVTLAVVAAIGASVAPRGRAWAWSA